MKIGKRELENAALQLKRLHQHASDHARSVSARRPSKPVITADVVDSAAYRVLPTVFVRQGKIAVVN